MSDVESDQVHNRDYLCICFLYIHSTVRTKVTTRPNQACVTLVTPTRRRDVMSRAQKLIINSHHATESLPAKIAVVAVTFIHHLSNINSGSGNPIVNSMLALRSL